MLRRLPQPPFRAYDDQPAVVVTAVNGLVNSARLFRLSNAPTERAIIAALGDFLDYTPQGEPDADWRGLRALADETHGGGDIREWGVAHASLPRPDFRSAGELTLYAFILIQAANIAEVELFESQGEAEAHGLKVCKEYFADERAAGCASFDQIVEMDADHDCSVYVVRLRAEGEEGERLARRVEPEAGEQFISLMLQGAH